MEETFICQRCGGEFPTTRRQRFGDAELCQSCLNETTVLCSHCGARFPAADNQNTDEFPICPDCRKRHYAPCVRCGVLVQVDAEYTMYDEDDTEKARPWCEECFWPHYARLHPEEMEVALKRRTLPGQTTLSPAFQVLEP